MRRSKKRPGLQLSDFYQLPNGHIVRVSHISDNGQTGRAYDWQSNEYDIVFDTAKSIMRRDIKGLIDAETDEQKRTELREIFEWMYKPPSLSAQTQIKRHVKRIQDIVQASDDIRMTDVIELLRQ
jgi:hypothetical protein